MKQRSGNKKRRIGVYDMGYDLSHDTAKCRAYKIWDQMLNRAGGGLPKRAQYADVTVCDDWLLFSSFKNWFDAQPYNYLELDKDILVPGNRIYGPDVCRYVPSYINCLIFSRGGAVSKRKEKGGENWNYAKPYSATICMFGKTVSTGRYATEDEASKAYKAFKAFYVMEVVQRYSTEIEYDANIGEALKKRAYTLLLEAEGLL